MNPLNCPLLDHKFLESRWHVLYLTALSIVLWKLALWKLKVCWRSRVAILALSYRQPGKAACSLNRGGSWLLHNYRLHSNQEKKEAAFVQWKSHTLRAARPLTKKLSCQPLAPCSHLCASTVIPTPTELTQKMLLSVQDLGFSIREAASESWSQFWIHSLWEVPASVASGICEGLHSVWDWSLC